MKPPSLVTGYSLIWSKDPAIVPMAPVDESLDEDAAERARKDADEERARQLRVARQTGDWGPLLIPGKTPVVFHFKNINLDDLLWIRGKTMRERYSELECAAITVRVALQKVEGIDKARVTRGPFSVDDEQDIADTAALNLAHSKFGLGTFHLLAEFGHHITARAQQQLDPL